MNLSWYDSFPFTGSDNLVDSNNILSIDVSSETVAEKTFWVVNNGADENSTLEGTLISFGFYLTGKTRESLNKLIELSSLKDEFYNEDLGCGVYILFGFESEGSGHMTESTDQEKLNMFRVTWNQGNSIINPITLDRAWTSTGILSYQIRKNFLVNNGLLTSAPYREGQGCLRVTLRVVVPPGGGAINSFMSDITLHAVNIREI